MTAGNLQRKRNDAALETEIAAAKIQKFLHSIEVDEHFAAKVPSAVGAMRRLKHVAEEAALDRRMALQDRSGTAEAAGNASAVANCASQKASLVLGMAQHAAALDNQAFGADLARRVARALRAGVIVRQQPGDRIEVCGRNLYEGVGLSFGNAGRLDCQLARDISSPKDGACFSLDSCWIGYEEEPSQQCAVVQLMQPGLHMGPQALSPAELSPEMCANLPQELSWLNEEEFVKFLSSHSERSLALLLGSGAQGSITKKKLEGAAARYEHYVTGAGVSGTVWYGARAFAPENMAHDSVTGPAGKVSQESSSSDILRSLANSREALKALEGTIMDIEQRWQAGTLDQEKAQTWLSQVSEQARAINVSTKAIETADLGVVSGPVEGLKRDVERNVKQVVAYSQSLDNEIEHRLAN